MVETSLSKESMTISKPIIEATKEALRTVLLSVIPILITQVQLGKFDLRIISVVALLAGLRWLDAWLHETGKARGNETLTKGLTRF